MFSARYRLKHTTYIHFRHKMINKYQSILGY